jgi:hypothetical protein
MALVYKPEEKLIVKEGVLAGKKATDIISDLLKVANPSLKTRLKEVLSEGYHPVEIIDYLNKRPPTFETAGEAISYRAGRIPQILKEEIKAISKEFKEARYAPLTQPWKYIFPALRALNIPFTPVRALVGEPVEELARKKGASEWLSQIAGLVSETAATWGPGALLKTAKVPRLLGIGKKTEEVAASEALKSNLENLLRQHPEFVKKIPVSKEEMEIITRNKIPKVVYRIEEGAEMTGVEKPHGLYTSPLKFPPQAEGFKGIRRRFFVNPSAKILSVDCTALTETNRGLVGTSAGVGAAKKLLGESTVSRLMKLPKKDLMQELKIRYPNVQWEKYFDQQEMIEALAGLIAREKGYDAIWGYDREWSEFVGLTQNAFKNVEILDIPVKKK